MEQHFYVYECPAGVFHYRHFLPEGVRLCGRFESRKAARKHVRQLRRDHLTPAYTHSGKLLTPRQRAALGVWSPELLEGALRMAGPVTPGL
jgi:hypothetical protein